MGIAVRDLRPLSKEGSFYLGSSEALVEKAWVLTKAENALGYLCFIFSLWCRMRGTRVNNSTHTHTQPFAGGVRVVEI